MRKKTNWITIGEAAKRFETPGSVIRAILANRSGDFDTKRKWAPTGQSPHSFGSRKSRLVVLVAEHQIREWCQTRAEFVKRRAISKMAATDGKVLNLSRGESFEDIENVYYRHKKMGKIYSGMRDS